MVKDDINNILIIKWGALGDLIASTSAIKTVRENFPKAKITLLTNSLMQQIIPPGFLVDELMFVKTNRNKVEDSVFKQIWKIFKLRRKKFDLAINLRWTSERAALITYLSGAKHRVSSGPKQLMNLYNIQVDHPQGRYHEIHRNLDIVKALDVTVKDENPVVHISDNDKDFADRFFKNNSLSKINTICIHPGASRAIRAWKPERFAEIGKLLIEKFGANILITWGFGEEILVQKVADSVGRNIFISPQTNTIGELGALIQNCKMFLSNCTGPMNVAVAVGTPVVALLGSSDPTDWGAYGDTHVNIKSPLLLEHYFDDDERRAMEAISVERVWEVVEKRWMELDSTF